MGLVLGLAELAPELARARQRADQQVPVASPDNGCDHLTGPHLVHSIWPHLAPSDGGVHLLAAGGLEPGSHDNEVEGGTVRADPKGGDRSGWASGPRALPAVRRPPPDGAPGAGVGGATEPESCRSSESCSGPLEDHYRWMAGRPSEGAAKAAPHSQAGLRAAG